MALPGGAVAALLALGFLLASADEARASASCAAVAAARTAPAAGSPGSNRNGVRAFALQPKQEARHVRTYGTFRRKIDCMLRTYVDPHRSATRPNVVVVTQDLGLMTIATGSRGARARAVLERRPGSCGPSTPYPCSLTGVIAAIQDGYRTAIAAYRARYPRLRATTLTLLAGSDTFGRGFMTTMAALARAHRVHLVAGGVQADLRRSSRPADIAAFRDPDLPRPRFVWVAASPRIYYQEIMWGPDGRIVAVHKKVVLTSLERNLVGATPGPMSAANVRAVPIPGSRARAGLVMGADAEAYGSPFGAPAPRGNPCRSPTTHLRCLDRRGVNLVLEPEANLGWALPAGRPWPPLEQMSSTWRAVADPTVRFQHTVQGTLVGNLATLPYDGQAAIASRAQLAPRGRAFIGDGRADPVDGALAVYAGPKRRLRVIAPWVVGSGDRARLRAIGAQLMYGAGGRLENDYMETGLWADLEIR